ncbi:MAG: hypothetical protein JWO86_528 [Myxococcaceae bacterium]|nr:hypothetical protein [Myxococcaceae bacterium]
MSTAALTLLVLIASGDGGRDASGPVATSMARAVREALGADAQVIIRETARVPSDDEAIALGRELRASAVIELLWKDPEHRRATLHFHADPGASRWTDREVGFDATDADAERGRMIGFALASMLPERAASQATVAPAPAAPPPMPPLPPRREPGEIEDADERSERPPARPGEVLRWFGAVDLAAAGSLGGDATGIGAALSARWDFAPTFSARVGGAVRAGDVGAADASSTIYSGALGLVWRALPATTTRTFGLALRADVLAMQVRLERASSHATLWLPGADLAVEASWMFAKPLALFAAVGGEVAFGAPDVLLFSNRVTTIPPFRGLGEAGIRVHF